MEIIKFIYEAFEKHGIWFIIQILLLCIVGGALFLLFIYLKKKIEKEKPNNGVNVTVNIDDKAHEEVEESESGHSWKELLNHSFFRSVEKMINYEIQHIDINERLRRAVFRDFLLIHFTVIQDEVHNFITSGNMDKMDSELFHNKLHSLITEFIQKYEIIAVREGIPEIVISKFNKWHRGKSEVIYQFVDDICEADNWYVSNSVKFYSFLNQLVSILDLTLIDARKTLIHLNGELDSVVYKGITSEKKSVSGRHSRISSDSVY